MVAVFIDESGNFTPTRAFSVVAALSLPHASLGPARRLLNRISHGWPRLDGELKGGALTPLHLHALVDCLYRQQALLHCTVAYIGPDDGPALQAHKLAQCESMTKHLTDAHHPNVKDQIWALRRKLEGMSTQLYVQCVAQKELLCEVVEAVPNYFSQRLPQELARFEWFIDAKDKAVTPQEQWWRDTLGPFLESRSFTKPFGRLPLASANYSFFNKEFSLTKKIWHPTIQTEEETGSNIRKLILDNLHFVDSKADILIQAIDILGRFVRRAMDGELPDVAALNQLGRLQIMQREGRVDQSVQLITLTGEVPDLRRLTDVVQRMSRAGRSMLTPESRRLLAELPDDVPGAARRPMRH